MVPIAGLTRASLESGKPASWNDGSGILANMTGRADIAVDRLAERLPERYPNVKFER